jgi:hypothetical protein
MHKREGLEWQYVYRRMRSTLFFHACAPNIHSTSQMMQLVLFLMVISSVLFLKLLAQLSFFLVDFFVGNHNLSSRARLEAGLCNPNLTYSSIAFMQG